MGNIPDNESVLRDAVLHCLQNRVLRLPESDVVVGDQAPSRDYRFGQPDEGVFGVRPRDSAAGENRA